MNISPYLLLMALLLTWNANAQTDTTLQKKLSLTGDFRFRIEQDWKVKDANGDFRDDRSRLRYRFRFGLKYQLNDWASFGGRLRSGNLNDQQGPHVTLGGNTNEFSLVQIGLEKLFFKLDKDWITAWIGKNTFPFQKQNELFWNDNVFPEGVGVKMQWPLKNAGPFNSIGITGGHFIINSSNKSFGDDSYLQALQLETKLWEKRISLFPSVYYFHKIADVPDGKGTFNIPYTILHFGAKARIVQQPKIEVGLDYYQNIEDYGTTSVILDDFKKEKTGFVFNVKVGSLKQKGDWAVHLYCAYLQKYAIVDYFAQNDWARWDYSSKGATGARLSNFRGAELRIGYAFEEKFNLVLRTYLVEQLVPSGTSQESSNRIRLDLNIGF